MDWQGYFEMMADWKKLPAYKAEPRIDSLVGYYLPDFMSDFLGIKVAGIIPELPLRLGTVNDAYEKTNMADRSYKVDFFIVTDNGMNYLVEFKTDSGSLRPGQDKYLEAAKSKEMKLIIEGIVTISAASNYKTKYGHLLEKLQALGLLNADREYSGTNSGIEIIYVQPSNPNKNRNIIDFIWIADWLESKYAGSEFEAEFSKALKLWSSD
ncbi:hypothetical protein OR1_01619 [Geobacter sp. OR-1]|uniref:hypothetical protein n=1 Tax=Geobacter sp. OR-1 TaxID=1266765 RepID=UPI00054315A3|nr:hypothetical protein [Geobacter sp. OR-1]GAM09344.1 hypothetical protein OR1_01619 [Geobacter sp. OR-1]